MVILKVSIWATSALAAVHDWFFTRFQLWIKYHLDAQIMGLFSKINHFFEELLAAPLPQPLRQIRYLPSSIFHVTKCGNQ